MTTGDRLEWRISSFSSNGESCVQVAPADGWRTSSFSGNGENCVQIAPRDSAVYVRHSKHPEAGTITFPLPAWTAFLRETRTGATSDNGVVDVTPDGTDTLVAARQDGLVLRFDAGEWSAFRAGVDVGEFDFVGV